MMLLAALQFGTGSEEEPGRVVVPTVLVVEDGAALRVLTVSILHELGYDTLTPEGAAEARALIAAWQPKADLVFADIKLSGGDLDGLELAWEAVDRHPGAGDLHQRVRPDRRDASPHSQRRGLHSEALHNAATRGSDPQDASGRVAHRNGGIP